MSPALQGSLVLVVTLLILLSGIPVAFGLGAVAIVFLAIFQGFDALHVVAETFWSGLDEFTLVAIPMFGINHSYPVSVAAGIVMAEWARRYWGRSQLIAVPRAPEAP